MHIERVDLVGVLDPLARAPASGKIFAKYRLPIEALALLIVGLTGHLGGFLSGVNGTP